MRPCHPLSAFLMLSLFFLLPAWGDVPDAPPLGACYMGYGKMLESGQSRQLSLNAHVTRFLYQPGGLEIAYEGSQKDGDEVTQFIRLAGVRRGATTNLVSTTIRTTGGNDQNDQNQAPYSLAGWSGDGRYLLISQEHYATVPNSDGGYHSDTRFLCVDVGADPIHLTPVTLPDAGAVNPAVTAGLTRYWWSPNRNRVLFAWQGDIKQGGDHTFANVFSTVYTPATNKLQDVFLGEKQVIRGWIDASHLLVGDVPSLTLATSGSKAHYASYDLLTGTQSETPKPAIMPAQYNDMDYLPGAGSPKAAYLRLEDEAHHIEDQQKVGAVDAHALWVRRTKGPKLQSAAPVGLTPGADDPQAVWSPTGTQIAFIAHGDLFVTDLTMRDATLAEKYKAGETLTCQEEQMLASSDLKQVGLALLQYCQDYDESFPPADQWQDSVKPYFMPDTLLGIGGHPVVYHMPAGMTVASIDAPADTVLGTIELPCATVTLYADGHVKALPKPTEQPTP